MYQDCLETPIGYLHIQASNEGLRELQFRDNGPDSQLNPNSHCHAAREQLHAYFKGELSKFDLVLDAKGTDFQERVWQALNTIQYGVTLSYGEVAELIGQPTASRAVGLANGKNPLAIVVPCHRVIGADGSLTGYAGGMMRKQWLLELEGVKMNNNDTQGSFNQLGLEL